MRRLSTLTAVHYDTPGTLRRRCDGAIIRRGATHTGPRIFTDAMRGRDTGRTCVICTVARSDMRGSFTHEAESMCALCARDLEMK